ncbi:MAG: hypothetical protein E7354_00925 [Clostridiales bacterium]|nr:hypothetical protein [Clostridiales bacterium]
MNNYSIDSAIAGKVASIYTDEQNKNELDDIVKSIKKINDSFGLVDLPEYSAPDFMRLENIDKSQTDIENEAKRSLEEYKNSSLSDIDSSIENQRVSLEKNRDTLKKSKEDAVNEVSSSYDAIRNNASNDALKRGLARSSIVVSILDAFNNDEIETLNRIGKEYGDSLNAIDFELNALESQKQKAISDFDIAYAVKLSDKINQLNDEYSKKQQEIIKYNNDISEKEKEYQDKYNSLVADIQNKNISNATKQSELLSKYGSKVISNYTKNQIFNVLDNYLANKSKSDRISILSSDSIKDALGSFYEEAYKKYSE